MTGHISCWKYVRPDLSFNCMSGEGKVATLTPKENNTAMISESYIRSITYLGCTSTVQLVVPGLAVPPMLSFL